MNWNILLVLYPIYFYVIVLTVVYFKKIKKNNEEIEKLKKEHIQEIGNIKNELRQEFNSIVREDSNNKLFELEVEKFKWTKDMNKLQFAFDNLGSNEFDEKMNQYCEFAINNYIISNYINNSKYRRLGSKVLNLPDLTESDRHKDLESIYAMIKSSLSAETYSAYLLANFDLNHSDGKMYILSKYIAPIYNELIDAIWQKNFENTNIVMYGGAAEKTNTEIQQTVEEERYNNLLNILNNELSNTEPVALKNNNEYQSDIIDDMINGF